MRVYLYDSVTGEYTGFWDCQKDPENESESGYLVPEHSTTISPTIQKGYVSFFKNRSWLKVKDYRKTPLWSTETGHPVQITKIEPLPENVTDIEKPNDGVYLWVDGAWIKQPEIYTCNAWQFRSAATELNLRSTIEDYVKNASPDIQDAYYYLPSFSSNNEKLLSIAKAIKKTKKDVDAIIQLGSTLMP